MHKVLAIAYACEPGIGSEPEVGWQWVRQISKHYEVWVITRASNRRAIEKSLASNPLPPCHFVYFDYPGWFKFWKKGRRGIHLYYILWQIGAYFKIKALRKSVRFSIVHHVTFVNSWLPSVAAWIGIPFVWGPIGRQHMRLSFKLLREFGLGGAVTELTRKALYGLASLDPLVRHTYRQAKKIIVINRRMIDRRHASDHRFVVRPAIAVAGEILGRYRTPDHNSAGLRICFGGAMTYLKGVTFAVRAFAQFSVARSDTTLIIIGVGSQLEKAKNIVGKVDLAEKVTFVDHLCRDEFLDRLMESDVFLYPTFEGGGLVVLEAMAMGKPVICLDAGGPGEFVAEDCGIKVKVDHPAQMIADLSTALKTLADDRRLRVSMGQAAAQRARNTYNWDAVGDLIKDVYSDLLENRPI